MDIKQILLRPIPDMTLARKQKIGYRDYALDLEGERNREPLVDIAEYGIAGQSYYARHNAAAGILQPAGTPILVRQSLAQKLADINYSLQQSKEVSELIGGQVELYVEEGLRDHKTQQKLYDEVFPALIRKQYPKWTTQQVAMRRDELIAAPGGQASPSPHATGAAVDITLRFVHASGSFARGALVPLNKKHADISHTAEPDYFEHQPSTSSSDRAILRNRRILYWVMRGALLTDDSGLEVNPTEYWHWSYGDQLWAKMRNAPRAFFGSKENM